MPLSQLLEVAARGFAIPTQVMPRRSLALGTSLSSYGAGALLLIALGVSGLAAAAPATVFLEEMTSPEVKNALSAGKTTIILPVGGTEQNGPHMTLGKHNVRVRFLAGRIAQQLDTALVAPVLSYVPEGSISPPSGHMRFSGTISVSEDAFKAVLVGAANSLRQHGFLDIVLLGDHGGYQDQLRKVATQLNRAWLGTPARVHFIADYYRASQIDFARSLRGTGLSEAQIGAHAGAADTSLALAIDPSLVRVDQLLIAAQGGKAMGVEGDPRASSAALGQAGVDSVVKSSVGAIRSAVSARR